MSDIPTPDMNGKKKSEFRISAAPWVLLGIVEVLLILRLIFKWIDMDPKGQFTDIVYGFSGMLLTPVKAIVPLPTAEGAVFEWTTLLSIVFYALLFTVIVLVVKWVQDRKAARNPHKHATADRERDKTNIQG